MIPQAVGLRSWKDGVALAETTTRVDGAALGEVEGLHFEYVNCRCL